MDGAARTATYREVFAVPEFRRLWAAMALSRMGDQLAAVALAVLVFDRTGSPFWTAVVYATTFLPWVVGGPLFGGLADRYPRRLVMITCDLLRAVLVAAMAWPGLPLPLLLALLTAVVLADPPFSTARAALLPDVLPGDRYPVGTSVVTLTHEVAQVAGFVAGGVVVAAVGSRGALLLDAGTYLVSAVLLAGLRRRPAPAAAPTPGWWRRTTADVRAGVALLAGSPALRRLTGLAWLAAFTAVPEALAVTYAERLGAGPTAAGLLLAANPLGTVVGSVWLARWVQPTRRLRLLGPLAVLSCAPLIACAGTPAWPVAAALFVLSGLGSAYHVPASTAFVTSLPSERRGQALGLVAAGMAAGQGLALLVAGAAAEHVSPGAVIAGSGIVGSALAVMVARRLRVGQHAARSGGPQSS